MTEISKTTITFTVLHPASEALPHDLADILEETDSGNAVGWVTATTTEAVPPEYLRAELIALGNDGGFFDEDDE